MTVLQTNQRPYQGRYFVTCVRPLVDTYLVFSVVLTLVLSRRLCVYLNFYVVVESIICRPPPLYFVLFVLFPLKYCTSSLGKRIGGYRILGVGMSFFFTFTSVQKSRYDKLTTFTLIMLPAKEHCFDLLLFIK